MKIFGIGLQKTGTTTLGTCLELLGYKHMSYDHDSIFLLRKKDYKGLFGKIDQYDSFEDQPWASLFKEVDKKYPDSKFILTVRKDHFAWYNSIYKHCKRIPHNEHREFFFGYNDPHNHKDHYINVYNMHNENVIDHFENHPEKLLVICWEKGDSWKELCSFLNKEHPNIPFPHENKAPSLSGQISRKFINTFNRLKSSCCD